MVWIRASQFVSASSPFLCPSKISFHSVCTSEGLNKKEAVEPTSLRTPFQVLYGREISTSHIYLFRPSPEFLTLQSFFSPSTRLRILFFSRTNLYPLRKLLKKAGWKEWRNLSFILFFSPCWEFEEVAGWQATLTDREIYWNKFVSAGKKQTEWLKVENPLTMREQKRKMYNWKVSWLSKPLQFQFSFQVIQASREMAPRTSRQHTPTKSGFTASLASLRSPPHGISWSTSRQPICWTSTCWQTRTNW